MEFFVQNWPLVLLALVSGGMLLAPTLRGGAGASSIGAAEAVRLINREKGILIDVGEPAEYAQGHPAGARNVLHPYRDAADHGAEQVAALVGAVPCPRRFVRPRR